MKQVQPACCIHLTALSKSYNKSQNEVCKIANIVVLQHDGIAILLGTNHAMLITMALCYLAWTTNLSQPHQYLQHQSAWQVSISFWYGSCQPMLTYANQHGNSWQIDLTYVPHKQYHSVVDFQQAYKEPKQEAGEDEQSGKPIYQGKIHVITLKHTSIKTVWGFNKPFPC